MTVSTAIQHEDDGQLQKQGAGLVAPRDLGAVESNDVAYPTLTYASPECEQHQAESGTINSLGIIQPVDELDEVAIAQLRQFFALLDRWERELVTKPVPTK